MLISLFFLFYTIEATNLLDAPNCLIPDFPVLDTETAPLFAPKATPYQCEGVDQELSTQIRRINGTKVQIPKSLNCSAREILPGAESSRKSSFTLGELKELKKEITEFPTAMGVLVECGQRLKKTIMLIPYKQPDIGEGRKLYNSQHNETKPNFLLLGIDSVSRLQYHRHLKRTKKILEQNGMVEFLGYHRVGEYTYMNVLPMMIQEPVQRWQSLRNHNDKVDALPLLFKKFQHYGYLTSLFQDLSVANMFYMYGAAGFQVPPVDYYVQPVSASMDSDNLTCHGGESKFQIYTEYCFDMMETLHKRNQSFLIHAHLSTMSRTEANNLGYADFPLEKFFQRFFASELRNNTLVFLYSDHGIHYGPLKRTKSGHYESILPMMLMYSPPNMKMMDISGRWLETPELNKIARENAKKLTSHFDVPATLMHVLHNIPTMHEMFGQSLFTPISEDRRCHDAGIPFEYCACNNWRPFPDQSDSSRKMIQIFADTLMSKINSYIAPFIDFCEFYFLSKIVSIEVLPDGANETFKITIQTKPGNAIFWTPINRQNEILAPIQRLDDYYDNNNCASQEVKPLKFCTCKESRQNLTKAK